jgi:hypothetical protein
MVSVNGTLQEDGGIRFRLPYLKGLEFIRYPASIAPPENCVAIVTGDRFQTGGVYQDGAWRRRLNGEPFKREVKFWTLCEGPEIGGKSG